MIYGARISFILITVLLIGAGAAGCRKAESPENESEVLLRMEDSVLTMRDVVSRIPVGVTAEDSVAMFRKIVDGWVSDMVLTDMAESRLPDYEDIENKVSAYRKRLIVMSYLSMMRSGSDHKVREDSIRKFYERHRQDLLSERPLVKGLLLKVPESVNGLDEIRRSIFSANAVNLDELESKWATDAVRYDYFEHTWVDWQSVAEQIPYRFFDPDAFLASTKNFETNSGGSVYLLHISDYLPSGSELPYDFAAVRIKALLEKVNMSKYEGDLVTALIKRAIADEKLQIVGYDPVKGEMIGDVGERNKE